MVFGKIEYLNLLPFHIFMKRFAKSSQQKMSMHYHRGVPAIINQKFTSKKVDAAFISSIAAKKYRYVKLGIIAKKEVLSVIIIPNADNEKDVESASSNLLASILKLQGKVLIGDKALKYSLGSNEKIDLAAEWNQRYGVPFVFALLCYHKHKEFFKRVEKRFLHEKVKIPQYILNEASQRTKIDGKDIKNYLRYISYDLDIKAQRGLKKFYSLEKRIENGRKQQK